MSIEQNQTIASSKNYGDIDPMVKALANHIDFDVIKTIYDVGSRDALESRAFTSVFPNAKIFAFEPNPEAFKICIENVKGFPNISVHQVAVSNTNGEIDFFAADLEKSRDANLGISSMFKLMSVTPLNAQWDQKQIKVRSITLDAFVGDGHPTPDLIWSDVQGAELLVFQGAERILQNVKAIYTEAGKTPYYYGQTLIPEIDTYLKAFGFKCVMELRGTHDFECDFLYINENH